MSTLINPYHTLTHPSAGPSAPLEPVHLDVPTLLEYRGEEDPDAEFIPKTVAGFCIGAMTMGVALDLASTFMFGASTASPTLYQDMFMRIVFMMGITGVSASLLLVSLKVREEFAREPLYARHWLNSIGTGAMYALMVWIPWSLMNHKIPLNNHFLDVGLLLLLSAVPLLAARWTIGPHHRPA